jgi:hypothetical protein
MPSEPLSIFDPRRNFQLQGFSSRAATTTLHDATATAFRTGPEGSTFGALGLTFVTPPLPNARYGKH